MKYYSECESRESNLKEKVTFDFKFNSDSLKIAQLEQDSLKMNWSTCPVFDTSSFLNRFFFLERNTVRKYVMNIVNRSRASSGCMRQRTRYTTSRPILYLTVGCFSSDEIIFRVRTDVYRQVT